jgi:hypothetical protein
MTNWCMACGKEISDGDYCEFCKARLHYDMADMFEVYCKNSLIDRMYFPDQQKFVREVNREWSRCLRNKKNVDKLGSKYAHLIEKSNVLSRKYKKYMKRFLVLNKVASLMERF